ncbi:nitronate monooxygenase [Candidatus Woesearchaeota archaeon]|jgi:NAD(P)H-dependent flavin oxidoreductase YrpB (nitropropane dioxygenase family)|nr:nitronate monooxygenase [Candidatus Woesearchaeota archaeon]MBT6044959.1 nitronate monooxygenase [Candidatus Woesearchaeota archaeon]
MSLERILLNGELPRIIQGGMGVAVSNWRLARAVSMEGQLGVVSGTGIDVILARRLQEGDKDGRMRAAIAEFPIRRIADEVLDRYFVEGGKDFSKPYVPTPFPKLKQDGKNLTLESNHLQNLIVLANFVEVYLAKQGHNGKVGINLLHKVQHLIPQGLYGAMLAGVDAVLIGAGLPKSIPDALDALVTGETLSMPFPVNGGKSYRLEFDSNSFMGEHIEIRRPAFLGIVSNQVPIKFLPNAEGYIIEGLSPFDNGEVIQGPLAGGHNAGPRKKGELSAAGELVYGLRDKTDFEILNGMLDRRVEGGGNVQPYWLVGGCSTSLKKSIDLGATGVQVGTLFATSIESGIKYENKEKMIESILDGASVFADPNASPTGYPFQVFPLDGSLSEKDVYGARKRVCDMGGLLEFFEDADGVVRSRCASEPVHLYTGKGGTLESAAYRKCLCQALVSWAGFPTVRKDGSVEPSIATLGRDTSSVRELLEIHGRYSAADAINLIKAS